MPVSLLTTFLLRSARAHELLQAGATVTPHCQKYLDKSRERGRDWLVFIIDMTKEKLQGEVQVRRAFFYSVLVKSDGTIECKCRYTLELGMPCDHAVSLIDEAYSLSHDLCWDITNKKW